MELTALMIKVYKPWDDITNNAISYAVLVAGVIMFLLTLICVFCLDNGCHDCRHLCNEYAELPMNP